ncbi:MAG TPA: PKD domain-containing protein [Methanosarcina sp.]|nr:PKD domain-containing protein [Methanosarcina sp.]
MKKKEKEYSIALASTMMILFLILISSMASAYPSDNDQIFAAPEITGGSGDTSEDNVLPDEIPVEEDSIATESIQPAALKITETRITTNKSEQSDPIIYGNKIAWTDYSNGNADIYVYDLSTKKELHNTNVSEQLNPDIYGNRLVWSDYYNEVQDIHLQDLSTSKEIQIPIDAEGSWDPAIYGDKIVCVGYRGEPYEGYDIYIYDISTKKGKRITTDSSDVSSPVIYGDRIVWMGGFAGMTDIYMYNLSTSQETRITNSGFAGSPAIYGNRILWDDWRNENTDIYMYDLSTKKETQITTNASNQYSSAIYGDRIVWEDNRNGNADIYVYDLATGQECHTTDKSDQYDPEIYGDRIVWTDMRNGNADIYMGTLSAGSPVAAFSASPTSGKAPLNVAFTDKSTGTPTSWKWTFGDGTSSTTKNPTHKYSKVGKYTVSLTVKNVAGSNTVTKKDYIKVVTKPVASFSAKPTSGKAPLTVAFTDKSTGIPTSWKWNFGDGASSTEQNPKHEYLQEGNYKVTLTVTNVAGSNTVTKTNFIKVTTNTRPGIHPSE